MAISDLFTSEIQKNNLTYFAAIANISAIDSIINVKERIILKNFARFLVVFIVTLFGFIETGPNNGSLISHCVYENESRLENDNYHLASPISVEKCQKQQLANMLIGVDDTESASFKFFSFDNLKIYKKQQQLINVFSEQKIKSRNLLIKLEKIDLLFPFNVFW